MTPGRHAPGCVIALVLLLVAIALGYAIVYVAVPAVRGERPADLAPTPVRTILDPTPRTVASPSATPTVEPAEALPAVTSTRVPPTETPRATDTPTPAPTVERSPVQRG